MKIDDILIKVYNKRGAENFANLSDKKLIENGFTKHEIKRIKVERVKYDLNWHKNGIETYKALNKLLGGKNVI